MGLKPSAWLGLEVWAMTSKFRRVYDYNYDESLKHPISK